MIYSFSNVLRILYYNRYPLIYPEPHRIKDRLFGLLRAI